MKKRFLAILLIILPAIITFAQDNYESGVLLLQVKQPHIVSLDNTKVINGSAELQNILDRYLIKNSRKLSHVNTETDGWYRLEFQSIAI